ncbi:MAG: hypothetical protein H6581_20900 [Bacteroidia bacterium]|nr:hypothetical protein [Bacteroidia bacterium]
MNNFSGASYWYEAFYLAQKKDWLNALYLLTEVFRIEYGNEAFAFEQRMSSKGPNYSNFDSFLLSLFGHPQTHLISLGEIFRLGWEIYPDQLWMSMLVSGQFDSHWHDTSFERITFPASSSLSFNQGYRGEANEDWVTKTILAFAENRLILSGKEGSYWLNFPTIINFRWQVFLEI